MGFVFAVTLFISGMICGVVGVGALLIWFLNDKTRKIERQIATFPDLGAKNLPKQAPVIIKLPPTVGSAASATILQDSKQRKLICEVFEASIIVAADNNGMADPFLKIKLNDQTVKTRTLLNTLTPKWGESFVLMVDDAQIDKLEVQLFDGDKPKEPLGEISVSLAELVKDHPKDLYLPFQGVANTKQGKVKSQCELRLQLTLVDFNSDLPLSVKSKRDKKREKEARARDKDKDKEDKDKEERRKEREERKKKDKEDRRQRMAEKKREEREKKERKREEKRQRKEDHSGEQSESSVRESESSSASLAMSRAATSTSLSFVSDMAASSASNLTNKDSATQSNSARSLTSKDSARSLSARRDSVNSDAPFTEPSISEEESFASETGSVSARKKHHDVNMAMKGWLEMKRDKTSPRPGSSNKEKLWFVLEGNKLKYFKTAPLGNDPLPLGVIDLTAAKVRKSRTKKKTFSVEIPVTHSNHVTSPHVTVTPDTQQDPVGKKDVQKRKYQLKAATKAMLDMWVSALQSRGVMTEERRDSRSGVEQDVDSDSESAMLTAVTEVSDSEEETSFKSDDEDSKSESSDKVDAVTGLKKEKNLTGSVPNLPLHSKISLLDSAPAAVSQSARTLPITSRADSDPTLASTESSESRDDLQEAQVEFLEKELKDLDHDDVITESKATELKIDPLQRVGAEATSGAGGDWLNVFLGRIFRDMQTCQIFLEEIKTKIRDQFEKIPKRTFMGPVVLKNFDFGQQFFKFHNLRFMPTSTPDEVVGEALVTYEKGFGLTAACEFYVNWPKPMTAVIPLEVSVSIEKCIGTWHFRFPPEVNTRMEICFVAPPDIEFDFLITVVGRNTRLSMLPQLRRFLFGLVKKSLTNLFVYPSKLKLFIPLPARRADTVLENPLRQRPRMPASGRTVPSRRDRPDVRARKTIVARFLNEVLNQRRFDQLQDLFTEDCLVHGSSLAGAVHQGRDAVKQHILELQNAFPDLVFYIEDLVADGVNVFVRWLARGTHKGQLWDYPGTGEERLLRGSMMCKVKEGNQRITDMYFFWSISSVYSLL